MQSTAVPSYATKTMRRELGNCGAEPASMMVLACGVANFPSIDSPFVRSLRLGIAHGSPTSPNVVYCGDNHSFVCWAIDGDIWEILPLSGIFRIQQAKTR